MHRPVLLTAFDAYGVVDPNPSADVARTFESSSDVVVSILPTIYTSASERMDELLARAPRAVLMLGHSDRTDWVRVERTARNQANPALLDNDGRRADPKLLASGPDRYAITADEAQIAEALDGAGVAWNFSDDAGRYVCNATYFHTLHRLRSLAPTTPCLFLHMPGERRDPSLKNAHAAVRALLSTL